MKSQRQTPLGIVLISLLLALYGIFWVLTWILAGMAGNGGIAALSLIVAVGVMILAYFLYAGSRAAWWITIVFVGGSTLWRLSLVSRGDMSNLLNAAVGVVIVFYLLHQRDFHQPFSA